MNSKLAVMVVFGLASLPSLSFAQVVGYTPLIGIPGITDNGITFESYINALYALSISIAALLAVIKIIIAGMKWMLSDVVTSKGEAIEDIKGAVFGLIVVISAVLILTVINPQLTRTQIFLEPVTDVSRTGVGATPGAIPITGTGYRALDLRSATPEAITAFSTECQAQTGSIYRVEGAGTAVCYAPLPSGVQNQLRGTWFPGAANLAAIERRFQTTHYPRMITSEAIKEAIRLDRDADEVLLAINITPQNDWLDSANQSAIGATCQDFQRSSDRAVTPISGDISGTRYVACVYMPIQ